MAASVEEIKLTAGSDTKLINSSSLFQTQEHMIVKKKKKSG